jgi:hypothetical protein
MTTVRAHVPRVEGWGHARPAPAASSGTASASIGRTMRKPAIPLRNTGIRVSKSVASDRGSGLGHPPENPAATVRASTGHVDRDQQHMFDRVQVMIAAATTVVIVSGRRCHWDPDCEGAG